MEIVEPGTVESVACKPKLLVLLDGTKLRIDLVCVEVALICKMFELSDTMSCAKADLAEISARATRKTKNANFSKQKFEVFFRIEKSLIMYRNYITFLGNTKVIFKVVEVVEKWRILFVSGLF